MHTKDAEIGRSSGASEREGRAGSGSGSSRSAGAGSGQDRPLTWPPPGLARLQGDAFGAVRWLAAGAVLVLPLLWAIVGATDPWSSGPLGETLWLAFGLGVLGVPVLLGGYVVLARLLRRTAQAVEQGHRWQVVALVAADQRRDSGFLLQGSRFYGALGAGRRRALVRNRLLVAGLLLLGSLWLSLGFGLGVVLAARGVLGPAGLTVVTLAPPLVAGLLAVLAYLWEERVLRGARRRWFDQPWTADLARAQVQAWNNAMGRRASQLPWWSPAGGSVAEGDDAAAGGDAEPGDRDDAVPSRAPERDRALLTVRAARVAVGALAVVAFIPVFALVFSAAILPMLARVSVPDLGSSVTRYAALEPLRRYALDPDPSITAEEAGEALHALSFVGRPYRASAGMLPPARSYATPWFPQAVQGDDRDLGRLAVDRIGASLEPGVVASLEAVAAHPAHAELALLARAPALDLAGARWSMPFPSDVTMAELPVPPVSAIRTAAYAHLARAALEAHRGDAAAAETTVREVLSAGLLLADRGPTLFDNMVGMVSAELAGEALERLYGSVGHPDAEALAWSRRATARGVARARAGARDDAETRLRAMPTGAVDPAVVPGARWEYVTLLNTFGPCMNLRRVVFGPDPRYDAWLERARSGLVRTPAEAELFTVARGGLLGGKLDSPPTWSTRLLALTMGGADRPGSCARVFGELASF